MECKFLHFFRPCGPEGRQQRIPGVEESMTDRKKFSNFRKGIVFFHENCYNRKNK